MESAERSAAISYNEKWIAIIAVVSGVLATGLFTWTKWEVEAKLKDMPDDVQQQWRDGTFKSKASAGSSGK
eukprot:1291969-Prymnesium_polylepis.1